MVRKGKIALFAVLALLTMLFVPANMPVDAAGCNDINFFVDWDGGSAEAHPSLKYQVPVDTVLTFTIIPNPALAGKEVKFSSPNQDLVLDPTSISDNGANVAVQYNLPQLRPNVNFVIRWKAGDTSGDDVLT